ncbi:MAG: response regulator transcription factor [Rhodospirillales bacterium]|nr:response regulator transcription factor [Rhodospirillales bacterium]
MAATDPDPAFVAPASPVVVVDDDAIFADAVCANLEAAGLRAVPTYGGQAALDYFRNGGTACAIILDWHMPGIAGPDVLSRLRTMGDRTPVLFLTGLNQQVYEETALARGAVDFVDKSRSFSIVLQRLKLALAGDKGQTGVPMPPRGGAPAGGRLAIDRDSARATWRGSQVDLTLTEFKVVALLAAHAGRDVSYREIYDIVRGEGFRAGAGDDGYRANVRALVKRIRQKFKAIDPDFANLENYPGFGYRWAHDR